MKTLKIADNKSKKEFWIEALDTVQRFTLNEEIKKLIDIVKEDTEKAKDDLAYNEMLNSIKRNAHLITQHEFEELGLWLKFIPKENEMSVQWNLKNTTFPVLVVDNLKGFEK